VKKTLALCGAVILAGWLPSAPADNHDEGCVSCHVEGAATDGSDFRVNALLAKVGHKIGPEKTAQVPTGCNRCHAADDSGAGTPLRKLIHSIHYEVPDQNRFMSQYEGNCRACHDMNASIGVATIKAGERNWEPKDIKPR
jgi:hypothetical protein